MSSEVRAESRQKRLRKICLRICISSALFAEQLYCGFLGKLLKVLGFFPSDLVEFVCSLVDESMAWSDVFLH